MNIIYYFEVNGNEQCSKLFHYLYDDVPAEMYLEDNKFLEADQLHNKSQRSDKPYKRKPEYIK